MTTYTVIGIYDDGQIFTDAVKATDAQDAITIVARIAMSLELKILGAIEGDHTLVAGANSDEDYGRAAYVQDLRG